MPRDRHVLTPQDIIPIPAYEAIRTETRARTIGRKRLRRLFVGPYATVHFENWDTMWLQVQEMLRIEKGGADQLADELAAYNPMIPDGSELTATLMFEIDDPAIRARTLGALGGVEEHVFLSLDRQTIRATPEGDVERSRPDGKASSVHFLHFPFTPRQIAAWKSGAGQAMFHIDHPAYYHIAAIPPETREELAGDF